MANTRRLTYEPLRSIDSATFTGSYQTLGSPLAHPSVLIRLVNNSNVLVTISLTGLSNSDVDVAPANSFWLYDVTSDSPPSSGDIYVEQGRQYYVKGSAGVGLVYLVVQYVRQI